MRGLVFLGDRVGLDGSLEVVYVCNLVGVCVVCVVYALCNVCIVGIV